MFAELEAALVRRHIISEPFREQTGSGSKNFTRNSKKLQDLLILIVGGSKWICGNLLFHNKTYNLYTGELFHVFGLFGQCLNMLASLITVAVIFYVIASMRAERRRTFQLMAGYHDEQTIASSRLLSYLTLLVVYFPWIITANLTVAIFIPPAIMSYMEHGSLLYLSSSLANVAISTCWLFVLISAFSGGLVLFYLLDLQLKNEIKLFNTQTLASGGKADISKFKEIMALIAQVNHYGNYIIGIIYLIFPAYMTTAIIAWQAPGHVIFRLVIAANAACVSLLAAFLACLASATYSLAKRSYGKINGNCTQMQRMRFSVKWKNLNLLKAMGSARKPLAFYCFEFNAINYQTFFDVSS